ncbi:MAG: restriction endonuclease subunit S, partial [Polyangiaceae bacterium]
MIWPHRELGDIADLQAGAGFPPALQGRLEGELPLAKVGDISRAVRAGGIAFVPPLNYITRAEATDLRAHIFPPGSTVFAKIGEAIAQNYRLFTSCDAAFDNNVMGAIPRADLVAPRYLFRFLQTVDLYSYSSKTTVPALRKSDLERIRVPVPPISEQRRIADILDKADAIRRKRKQAIALTEELLRSAFLEMFGDPVTNPKGLRRLPFADAALAIIDGDRGRAYPKSEDFTPSGHCLFLSAKNVTARGFDFSEQQFVNVERDRALSKGKLERGDVILTTRGTLGNSAHYSADVPYEHVRINSGMLILRANERALLPEFLYFFLRSPH